MFRLQKLCLGGLGFRVSGLGFRDLSPFMSDDTTDDEKVSAANLLLAPVVNQLGGKVKSGS